MRISAREDWCTFLLILIAVTGIVFCVSNATAASEKVITGSPVVSLQKQALPAGSVGGAISVASGDFDGDGMVDAAVGYQDNRGGRIVVYRGNLDSIYPNSAEARARKAQGTFVDSPFLSDVRNSRIKVTPEFLVAGDFDNDGREDVAAAARYGNEIHILQGDGAGHFKTGMVLNAGGQITSLISGDVNRRDLLMDLVAGVSGRRGSELVVYESAEGAAKAVAERIAVNGEVRGIVVGQLDDGYQMDIAAAAGNGVVLVSGRDRKLSQEEKVRKLVPAARAMELPMGQMVRGIAAGDFDGDSQQDLALVTSLGQVHLLNRKNGNWESSRWDNAGGNAESLLRARVSSGSADSLLQLDSAGRQLRAATAGDSARVDEMSPKAAVALRLNADGIEDLVVVDGASPAPLVLLSAPVTTYIVNDTDDHDDGTCESLVTGDCTLREAMLAANASVGADLIAFEVDDFLFIVNNNGDGPLPTITDTVTIDGTTSPFFENLELFVDTGTAPCDTFNCDGLTVGAGGSVIRGLGIANFRDAVNLISDANIVESNFIARNDRIGVRILGANNTIGGTSSSARNAIYGSNTFHIFLTGAAASGNTISANYIGVDIFGTTGDGSIRSSIQIQGASTNNIIGGTTNQERNIISDAGDSGVFLYFGTQGNIVAGNYVGTDFTGTVGVGNSSVGVEITHCANNTIGGTASGSRNVISDNGSRGIDIDGAGDAAAANVVQGNYVGLDSTGLNGLGNGSSGIQVSGPDNVIGGAVPGAGNVVSANSDDAIVVDPADSGFTGNVVQGNIVGLDKNGVQPLANLGDGISVFQDTIVGGTTALARNISSANDGTGIFLRGNNNVVQGNYAGATLGLDTAGNTGDGINVGGQNNLIGGDVADAGNVIVGNTLDGIFIDNDGNIVQGNLIGLTPDGNNAPGNTLAGVAISGANGNQIGGSTALARNVISGNGGNGVNVDGDSNIVEGNYIGTNVAGNVAMGNQSRGVDVISGFSVTIGGLEPGSGNVISGNSGEGIVVGVDGVAIASNYIGVNAAGNADLGNGLTGVDLGAFSSGLVSNNVISGNGGDGVLVGGPNCVIAGNHIGTSADGLTAIGNDGRGVVVKAASTTVGGDLVEDRNVISANGGTGVLVDGPTIAVVRNNFIGTDGAGASAMGNQGKGIECINGSDLVMITNNVVSGNLQEGIKVDSGGPIGGNIASNKIGTDATGMIAIGNGDAGISVVNSTQIMIGGAPSDWGNIVSGNAFGIKLTDSDTLSIQQNLIGTDALKTGDLHNLGAGLEFDNSTNAAVLNNTTAFNSGTGVNVANGSTGVRISQNSIFSNGLLGIDLDEGTSSNNSQAAPTLTSAIIDGGGVTTLTGTFQSAANTSYTLELFRSPAGTCDPSGFGEGKTLVTPPLAPILTDGSGFFAVNYLLTGLSINEVITMTATNNATLETSQFSNCVSVSTPATVSIADAQLVEGNSGTTMMQFTVNISQLVGADVTVNFTTADGTTNPANAGLDYSQTTNSVTIFAGLPSAIIQIPILGDALIEADETFFVNLTGSTGASISDPQALGTIIDDDALLIDDFGDDLQSWTVVSGTWNEALGNLVGIGGKSTAFAPLPWSPSGVSSCSNCQIEVNLASGGGTDNQIIIEGWFTDKANNVEIVIKEPSNKIILKQKSGGTIVAKKAVPVTIDPNTIYNIKISYNGTQFEVKVDDVSVMVVPSATIPSGNVGFTVKKTTATFQNISVTSL